MLFIGRIADLIYDLILILQICIPLSGQQCDGVRVLDCSGHKICMSKA